MMNFPDGAVTISLSTLQVTALQASISSTRASSQELGVGRCLEAAAPTAIQDMHAAPQHGPQEVNGPYPYPSREGDNPQAYQATKPHHDSANGRVPPVLQAALGQDRVIDDLSPSDFPTACESGFTSRKLLYSCWGGGGV
jgi:hypothetical protein